MEGTGPPAPHSSPQESLFPCSEQITYFLVNQWAEQLKKGGLGPSLPDGSRSGAAISFLVQMLGNWELGTVQLQPPGWKVEAVGKVPAPSCARMSRPAEAAKTTPPQTPRPGSPPELTATLPWTACAVSRQEHRCFCLLRTELSSQPHLASTFSSENGDNDAPLVPPHLQGKLDNRPLRWEGINYRYPVCQLIVFERLKCTRRSSLVA